MSRKFLVSASLILVLLAVVAVGIVLSGSSGGEDGADAAGSAPARGGSESSTRAFGGDNAGAPKTERRFRDAGFVERYGEAKTNLARQVSGNVVSLLDDAVQMGEMMLEGRGPGGGNRWQLRRLTRGAEIELDESQRERAETLLEDYRRRELDRSRRTIDDLRRDPENLMALVLAGDARARGEISEDEYAAQQQSNADALSDVINPLDRDNFRGGDPLADEEFRRSFEGLLDDDQAAAFAEANPPAPEGEPAERGQTDITEMPVMELETLDEAVGSAKQMTSGLRQLMEGMGNLDPLLEQQRARENGDR